MNRLGAITALAGLVGLGFAGCQNTAQGVKEDTARDTRVARIVADRASVETKKAIAEADAESKRAATNASAATMLTPRVKHAITSDPNLNDSRNLINVDSANGVVHLKGHVVSAAMKHRASQVAQHAINEAHATDKLSNELAVEVK